MQSIGSTEARADFANLLRQVSETRERVIITHRGGARAALVPLDDLEPIQGRVDQVLTEAQQRFKDFADAGADWFWEMDANCRFSYFSERFTEITGLSQASLLGKTSEEANFPTADAETTKPLPAILATHRPFRDFTFLRPEPDGTTTYCSIDGKAIFDKHGDFCGYRGSARDVTEPSLQHVREELERHVAERTAELSHANDALTLAVAEHERVELALRERETELDEALEAMSEGFAYFDAQDRLIRCNSKHLELFPSLSDFLVPGVDFEETVRRQLETDDLPWARGREDAWVAERVAQHRAPGATIEQEFGDGRIMRLSEYRTRSGGVVSIRTDITELKRIESALRASEARFKALFDSLPFPTNIKGKDGVYLLVNTIAAELFDMPAEDIVGRSSYDFFSEEVARSHRANDVLVVTEGNFVTWENAVTFPDGQTRDVMTTKFPIFGAGGDIEAIGTLNIDISERVRMGEELAKSEERLMQAIECIPEGFILFDLEDKLVLTNERYREFNNDVAHLLNPGTPFETVLRESMSRRRIGEFEGEEWVKIRLALHRQPQGPFEERHGDGRWYRVEERRTQDGGYVGTRTDITALRQAQESLQQSEERLQQATKLAKIGYWVWDAVEDRCLFCSDQHARVHGLTPDEYMATASSLDEQFGLTHPEDRDMMRRAMMDLRNGKAMDAEYRSLTPDGESFYVREIAMPVFDETGRVVQEVGTSQDITELKQAQEQLRQAQKLQAVGQLTGGVAHDFNNLLAVIMGHAELLQSELRQKNHSADAILQAASRGAELTQRLLAFSRRQPLQPKILDAGALTLSMKELLQRTLGETVFVEIVMAPELWHAMADPGQLENALLNLALNGRDAMVEGGRLGIEIGHVTLDATQAASREEMRPGDYVVLSVSDTGTGMSPSVLEHAFEPFFTTKDVGDGSGLGLSMVYGFAKQSGGDVEIVSAPKQGTTVRLYLPRARQNSEVSEKEAAIEVPKAVGETVLVVEDDPDVRILAARMLGDLGYRVLTAADGAAGIKAMQNAADIDLVLSDVVLPHGMSGFEMAERLRQANPETKILFMSGYAEDGDRLSAPRPNDEDTLQKPFRRRELAHRVRDALDR